MGHQFTIESDEAFALATELAALTGESLDDAVAGALRDKMEAARKERAASEDALRAVLEFHDLLSNPPPASDHRWMYDEETGLPIW